MVSIESTLKQLTTTPRTWLITGVAGFIGSNLLETLLSYDQKVIGLDNFSTGSKKNLQDVLNQMDEKKSANFTFHEGDICSLETCHHVMHGVDIVLHQAALGSVPRSIKTPELTNASNVSGFINVLIAANKHGVKRVVYASSSSVYGDLQSSPKKESEIGKPLSPYAVSKYSNELYAHAFSTCYGLETIGLRYFNVFGPRQNPMGAYAAVIPKWIHALLHDEPISIYGDGETSRDFCYIDNAVQANLLAATTDNVEALNTVYNITFGQSTTLNELYAILADALNKTEAKLKYQAFREGDIRHSLADISRARERLNYAPQYQVKDGLHQTIRWFLDQNTIS